MVVEDMVTRSPREHGPNLEVHYADGTGGLSEQRDVVLAKHDVLEVRQSQEDVVDLALHVW